VSVEVERFVSELSPLATETDKTLAYRVPALLNGGRLSYGMWRPYLRKTSAKMQRWCFPQVFLVLNG
jgi:hypothetical protein